MRNVSQPKIIINDTIIIFSFLNCNQHFGIFRPQQHHHLVTRFRLSWLQKNSRTFPGPQKHFFPRPCHMPAMFKYRHKQQLLTKKLLKHFLKLHTHILASASSSLPSKFQDFLGPGNFTNTTPGLHRRHGNLQSFTDTE